MTRTDIISQVEKRTESRGKKQLDMKAEFLNALIAFVKERDWWWRRMSRTFSTVAGTPTYDFGADWHRSQRMKLYTSATTWVWIYPLFDPDEQDAALQDTKQDQPCNYFPDLTDPTMVRLTPIPNAVFTIRDSYWACPSSDTGDDQLEAVWRVPVHAHPIVQMKLEAIVLRFTLGEGAAKYQAAESLYQKMVADAADEVDFATGKITEYRHNDCDDAIQSTR